MTDEQEQIDETEPLVKTSVSLPQYLYTWIKEVVNDKSFNSQSSVMVVALSELKSRMDEQKRAKQKTEKKDVDTAEYDKAVTLVLMFLMNHPELVDEFNDLKKQMRDTTGYTRIVDID